MSNQTVTRGWDNTYRVWTDGCPSAYARGPVSTWVAAFQFWQEALDYVDYAVKQGVTVTVVDANNEAHVYGPGGQA